MSITFFELYFNKNDISYNKGVPSITNKHLLKVCVKRCMIQTKVKIWLPLVVDPYVNRAGRFYLFLIPIIHQFKALIF